MSRICLARASSSLIGMETSVERMASVGCGRFWTSKVHSVNLPGGGPYCRRTIDNLKHQGSPPLI